MNRPDKRQGSADLILPKGSGPEFGNAIAAIKGFRVEGAAANAK
jgi:hypothetical protein